MSATLVAILLGLGLSVAAPLAANAAVPVAVNDAYSTPYGTPLVLPAPGVLGNDSDGDGDALSIIPVTSPAHGFIVYTGSTGELTYTPNAGYSGLDSFTYQATDGGAPSNIAVVSLTVDPPIANVAPIGQNDLYSTAGVPLTVAAPGVLANDADPNGDPLTAVLSTGPSHGTLTLASDGSFVYSPVAGYVGPDAFSYQAFDGTVATGFIVVDLDVYIGAPNAAPVAGFDSYTFPGPQVTISAPGVLGNDTDADGDPLTAVLETGPAHGTITLSSDGSFVYTPLGGYFGPDSFSYRASDGSRTSNVMQVTLDVLPDPLNTPPVTGDDAYTTPVGVPLTVPAPGLLVNDTDAQSAIPLLAILASLPAHGTLDFPLADGSFTYTPNPGYVGVDTFTYRADDGLVAGNLATVTITTVVPAPPAPPAAPAAGPRTLAATGQDGAGSPDVLAAGLLVAGLALVAAGRRLSTRRRGELPRGV